MRAFSKVHPFTALVYFLCVLAIAMFLANPVFSSIALLGGILFCVPLTNAKEKYADLRFYLPLFILIAVTNPLFSHNGVTPLFFMNGNAVTLEAILYGIGMGLMLIAVLLWCKAYSYVMTTDKFLYLFGSIIPQLSLVLSMALRYIPMLKRQARQMRRSQKAMGLYSSRSYTDRVRATLRVFLALVGWSLEHAVETGKAMRARGYGNGRRTQYHYFRFGRTDAALLGICIAVCTIIAFGGILHRLDFFYYPRITQLNTSPLAMICYVAFAVLALLPFILETEELLLWNYYRSKI